MSARSTIGAALITFALVTHAQGQGSYGGIAEGIFGAVLLVILIAVALLLLLIRHFLGNKFAIGLLGAMLFWVTFIGYDAGRAEEKRVAAYKSIERAFAEGCAETTRTVHQKAKGDEQIYVRTHGSDLVPEYQRSEVLPSARKLGDGVALVADLPPDLRNAILVDLTYGRETLTGSNPGYEWLRTTYELTVLTVPGGTLIAHSDDKQARSGFCLGDLEAFLQVALNRRAVLHAENARLAISNGQRALPDAYVRAAYAEQTSGVFVRSEEFRNSSNAA